MIGVLSDQKDGEVAAEFFELFKTPWEAYNPGTYYDVLLCNNVEPPDADAGIKIFFSNHRAGLDRRRQSKELPGSHARMLRSNGFRFPVYSGVLTFSVSQNRLVTVEENHQTVGFILSSCNQKIYRIGYDLLAEVRFLLTRGQPCSFARIPTLDIHISNIRSWILSAGIPVVEIPPLPEGKPFFVCLTHDVDFAGIRNHRLDKTVLGFLYRATFGSVLRVLKKKLTVDGLLKNWLAVLSLPLVRLGLLKDFWMQFDRYAAIEKDLAATYFFVPFRNRPGAHGKASAIRAVKYAVDDITVDIRMLTDSGFEAAVHGIDSWADPEKGKSERAKIQFVTGQDISGVRMHWLYFDEDSWQALEKAGYLYDSTYGYNEAVGFKGGTLQPFRPLGVEKLLELPLHGQDTALFYADRMDLNESQALEWITGLIESGACFGGVLTLNWHHRSLAPERLWGGFYHNILSILKKRKAAFLSARSAIGWFQARRDMTFKKIAQNESKIKIRLGNSRLRYEPDMLLRLYKPALRTAAFCGRPAKVEFVDRPLRDGPDFELVL